MSHIILRRCQTGLVHINLIPFLTGVRTEPLQIVPTFWIKNENNNVTVPYPPEEKLAQNFDRIFDCQLPLAEWEDYPVVIEREADTYQAGILYVKRRSSTLLNEETLLVWKQVSLDCLEQMTILNPLAIFPRMIHHIVLICFGIESIMMSRWNVFVLDKESGVFLTYWCLCQALCLKKIHKVNRTLRYEEYSPVWNDHDHDLSYIKDFELRQHCVEFGADSSDIKLCELLHIQKPNVPYDAVETGFYSATSYSTCPDPSDLPELDTDSVDRLQKSLIAVTNAFEILSESFSYAIQFSLILLIALSVNSVFTISNPENDLQFFIIEITSMILTGSNCATHREQDTYTLTC
nr:BV-like protein [Cotesia vestalis bracovirus]